MYKKVIFIMCLCISAPMSETQFVRYQALFHNPENAARDDLDYCKPFDIELICMHRAAEFKNSDHALDVMLEIAGYKSSVSIAVYSNQKMTDNTSDEPKLD